MCVWQLKISHENRNRRGKGSVGALFLLQQKLTVEFWVQGSYGAPCAMWEKAGAPTKELKQWVGQNICNCFLLCCRETDYSHSFHWTVSYRFDECVCCTCRWIFISDVSALIFFEHLWNVSAEKIALNLHSQQKRKVNEACRQFSLAKLLCWSVMGFTEHAQCWGTFYCR